MGYIPKSQYTSSVVFLLNHIQLLIQHLPWLQICIHLSRLQIPKLIHWWGTGIGKCGASSGESVCPSLHCHITQCHPFAYRFPILNVYHLVNSTCWNTWLIQVWALFFIPPSLVTWVFCSYSTHSTLLSLWQTCVPLQWQNCSISRQLWYVMPFFICSFLQLHIYPIQHLHLVSICNSHLFTCTAFC